MGELVMRFLGAAELAIDGVPVHLRRRRSLALLAYLALTGRPHPREAMATLLSGEVDESHARKLLRNALTDLGEHGINDFLLVDRQTVAFDATRPHRLDVAVLDDLLATPAPPDPATLERAAAQLDQELLAGLVLRDAPLFESWLERERERRAGQVVRIVHHLLEHHLLAGDAEAGIALARRLLAVRPWHEETHRILMRLLARAGRHAAALEQYALCRRVLADELGGEPQPETTALYEQLRAGPVAPRHNIAVPAPDLIGREEELAELARRLGDPACRLVSLVGLGGVGKTRLALAAAARFAQPAPLAADHPFPDGVFLADLSGIAGPLAGGSAAAQAERRIVVAVGLALGLVFYGNVDRLAQLVAYVRPKRLLLILDNLEHLLLGVGALQVLLRECPGLTLLATTRAPLGVPEEYVYELRGLALPDGVDALEQSPAGRLFVREAHRLNVRLAPEDRPAIASICRLTDGLPLALVIAAGWLRALSCDEIARELDREDALFDGPARRRAAGRQSLRAIVAFAWRRLPPRERQALRRLTVFRGHFDRAACEAIEVALPSLLVLCEQSLLDRDGDDGYTLHQLVRQYGAEQLARRPAEEARVRARHAAYYAAAFVRQAADLYRSPRAHASIGADRENILAAWEWAATHLDLGLLAQLRDGLATWHQMAGLHREWADVLEGAVARLRAALAGRDDPALRVSLGWLLAVEANALMWLGDLDHAYPLLGEARQCARAVGMIPLEARVSLYEGRILHYQGAAHAAEVLQQALTLSRAIQDRRLEAEGLLSLGLAAVDVGRHAEAEAHLLRAEQAYRDLGDRVALGRLAVQRSRLHIARAEFARAEAYLAQSLPAIRSQGNHREEGWAYAYLGEVCDAGLGRHREADEHFDRAMAIARETGDLRYEAYALCARGRNALHMGDFAGAERHLGRALDLGRAAGGPVAVCRALHGLGLLAHTRGDEVTAEDLAQQALSLAVDTGRRPEQAALHLLLGRAQEHLGLPTAAASYAQALALARELTMPALCCEAEAGLASLALGEGEVARAAEHAAALVPYLREHGLGGCDEPGWVALTCYRALRAAHDPRVEEALGLGAALLERRAAALPAEWRPRYLEAFPARREVVERRRAHEAAGRRAEPPVFLFPVTRDAARDDRRRPTL